MAKQNAVYVVSRPLDRVDNNPSVVSAGLGDGDRSLLWEKTLLHRSIPGHEGDTLLFPLGDGFLALPEIIPVGPFMIQDELGNHQTQAVQIETWVSKLDAILSQISQGESVPYWQYEQAAEAIGPALIKEVDRRIIRCTVDPGVQAVALGGDAFLQQGEEGIPRSLAEKLVKRIFTNRHPNSLEVRKSLMARSFLVDPGAFEWLQYQMDLPDDMDPEKLLAARKRVADSISSDPWILNTLTTALDGCLIWTIRFPSFNVPTMRLRVVEGFPGEALFITTPDMKLELQGDYDGDYLYSVVQPSEGMTEPSPIQYRENLIPVWKQVRHNVTRSCANSLKSVIKEEEKTK